VGWMGLRGTASGLAHAVWMLSGYACGLLRPKPTAVREESACTSGPFWAVRLFFVSRPCQGMMRSHCTVSGTIPVPPEVAAILLSMASVTY